MTNHRSIGRLTAMSFMAAVACELSVLPAGSARHISWSAWFLSAAIGGVTKLTTEIGLVASFLLGFRPSPRRGMSFGDVRPAEVLEKTTVAPTPEAVDPSAKRPAHTWDRSLADRKLWLLKRSGLFGPDTKGAQIERACTLDDLRKAYKLVHDVYLGTGFIEPEAAGMRLRIFETTPDMATFVAKLDGRVVGVLSVVADTPEFGLPSDAAFKPELDLLRAAGARLCEATNQAVEEGFRKSAVPTELMRCAVAHFTHAGFDETIATVSPSHNSFYELLGFREIGSERSYSEKLHDPVVALGMNVDQYRQPPSGLNDTELFIHRFLAGENHFLPRVEAWAQEARRHFLDADLLAQLFVSERNFLAECSPNEVDVLQRRWGHELFAEVTGALFMPSTQKLVEAAMPSLGTRAAGTE